MSRVAVIYVDRSHDFWPSGWMVWACAALGLTDVSLIAYIVACAWRIWS